jgi:hypothetical protein
MADAVIEAPRSVSQAANAPTGMPGGRLAKSSHTTLAHGVAHMTV